MATKDITTAEFEGTVTGDGITFVDFWADWCAPCRSFAPTYEAASEKHADVTFAKVDTEANQDLAMQLGIQSIPTLMAFRDGILLYREAGALPAPALESLIDQIKGLDMEDVRAKVAEAKAQAEAKAANPSVSSDPTQP